MCVKTNFVLKGGKDVTNDAASLNTSKRASNANLSDC